MAEQKLILGNIRGPQGPAGPNVVSASTTTSGFENGHLLYNNNGHVGAKSFLDLVYPVGSIFEWADTGSGANLSTIEAVQAHFGGRWEEYGSGRVLVGRAKGIPEFSDVNKEGGEINHTLTIAEMPRHSHEMKWSNEGAVGSGHGCLIRDSLSGESWPYGYWTGQDGGGQAHNNLQPYITVFRYRRVA